MSGLAVVGDPASRGDLGAVALEGLRGRLARRGIKVSLASLSYWQQGRSRPERADSLRALRAIEWD
ncbi:hypothetical protein [Saccharopolyspora elongata]|uniref:Uncharacterized protein n=1 Tax=Saccharopolyspora elongata TaxID=2530387 RepID=A0A4V2YK66_9PSEU|nr:hypothetical protein [Saccharopolyspora elongata]TDD41467.1 hypothetical protein E1288_32630 [Saccharopolyspora elongata]